MPKRVTLEESLQLVKRVAKKTEDEILNVLSQEWAKDSNEFVYKDHGDLQDSVHLHSTFKLGILRWRTPYARRRYYEGGNPGDGNRNARPRWAEVAKAKHMSKYKKIEIKIFNKVKKAVYR